MCHFRPLVEYVDIVDRCYQRKSTMTETYAKLFGSILDSTVWQESLPTKVVWITMLAMKDRDGYVGASVPGLASRAGVTIKECEEALKKFTSPDPYRGRGITKGGR